MRLVTTIPMRDWRAVAPASQLAEEVGYDGIVTNELAWDPFPPLPIAALATERVELATGIVVAFPRSPATTTSPPRSRRCSAASPTPSAWTCRPAPISACTGS